MLASSISNFTHQLKRNQTHNTNTLNAFINTIQSTNTNTNTLTLALKDIFSLKDHPNTCASKTLKGLVSFSVSPKQPNQKTHLIHILLVLSPPFNLIFTQILNRLMMLPSWAKYVNLQRSILLERPTWTNFPWGQNFFLNLFFLSFLLESSPFCVFSFFMRE